MRKFNPSKLENLKKITNFRRAMKISELAQAHAKLGMHEAQIRQLRSPYPDGKSIEEININEKWRKWKIQELVRLNSVQVAMRVECTQIEKEASKAIAEDAIAEHHLESLKSEIKKTRRRQEEEKFSHFLSNDVSDKDI